MFRLVKFDSYSREIYVNPAHVVSVYTSSITIAVFDYIREESAEKCVIIETITGELISTPEDINEVIRKLEEEF